MIAHFVYLGSGVAEVAATALVAGLWQGIALAILTAVVLKLVPRTTATVRFLVWATVFAVSAAMPLVHGFGTASAGSGSAARVQVDARWSYLLAGMWVAASVWRLAVLAVEAVGLRAIWRNAVPVSGLEGLAAGRKVQVCTSDEVDRPSVIGFFAPRILIPAWLYKQLTTVELEHIVLHEIEHLRRRDDWVNLMQQVGLVVFPLSPALLWIDRRLSAEREIACDDGVLARTKTPRAYAASLTSIAQRRLDQRLRGRVAALALAAIGAGGLVRRRSELSRRIESILGRRVVASPAVAGALAVLLVAGVLGSAMGLARAPQLVSFKAEPGMSQEAVVGPVLERPVRESRAVQPVRAENVVFHPAKTQAVSLRRKRVVTNAPATVPAVERTRAALRTEQQPVRGQMFVLTDWRERAPVAQVFVKMPDGQVFATQYAAVPTQAGWLVVQL